MNEIPAKFDYKSSENKWRVYWESNEIYKSVVNNNKPKYSVVIPPPNVTGMLHIGHVLNLTIQDIYCRWKRMTGYEVCWVPGMDHAGIATQIKVEQELAKDGISKYDIGRDEFVKKIWDWKDKYGGIILKQLRILGYSVDWSKERFTLDEGLSRAVKEVFVDLYKKGYIYKGKRIINWDSITQTALSDDEISYREQKDKLYYIKYPIVGEEGYLIIATTRPETMFGDTAVAVNPDDKRYKKFAGKKAILPLLNKEIPIVFDSYVDKEFGTGALKITPAHDLNDFEVGKRHNLESINILNKDGKLNEHGLEFNGQTVIAARENVLKKLMAEGYYLKEEDYVHNVSISERSGAVIEPFLSDQWFVSMKKLSEPAIKVVKEGKIKFYPEKWYKTYFHWLNDVRDWCISRQLWWGHQIPIWYNKESGEIYCDTEPPKDIENWKQETDVLDTWFSSWLWPFSVFGWENSANDKENKELNYYYPTDFLSTAPEIIFLWVARMIISGIEYMGEIPFKDVYFHSTVRDGLGRKMSKSLGNSPNPLDLVEKFGADALRFTIIYLAPLGSDVRFDEKNTEIGRNFVTKVWNAGRFLLMNKDKIFSSEEYGNEELEKNLIDEWVYSRMNTTIKNIQENLNDYRLNEYTKSIYSFVWSDFCDWYIELIKIKISKHKKCGKKIIDKAINLYVYILKLLHPAIPFITEEFWHLINDKCDERTISKEEFPILNNALIDTSKEIKFEVFKEIVTSIRNLKTENAIAQKKGIKILIKYDNKEIKSLINDFEDFIKELCGISEFILTNESNFDKTQYTTSVHTGFEINLPVADLNTSQNKAKYEKEITELEKYLSNIDKKLSNKNFLENASLLVVNKEKQKKTDAIEKISKLKLIIGK